MKLRTLLLASAASLLLALPSAAFEVGDVSYHTGPELSDPSVVGGWECGGSSCSEDFAGTRTESRIVGYGATASDQVIVRGEVPSCPWPSNSRYHPGFKRNVDPVTCQSEYLGRSSGGSPIVAYFDVPTVTTVTKSIDFDPVNHPSTPFVVTVTGVTTVDAP